MEGYRTEVMTAPEADVPSNARRACVQFNEKRDLPLMLAVRNATFISHGRLYDLLSATGSETTRRSFNWRIQRLVQAGVLKKLPQHIPYSGPVYTIARVGLACLEACGEGLLSLTSESRYLANPAQIQHYLELGEIRAAFERANLLREWTGDVEVRSINRSIDIPMAKDYDAIADLEFEGRGYRVAVEYERSLKSSARYREIVAAIESEDQVQLLVYLTSSVELVYLLKAEFEERKFPLALAPSRQFCTNPRTTRMYLTPSLGGDKATIEEILRTISSGKDRKANLAAGRCVTLTD